MGQFAPLGQPAPTAKQYKGMFLLAFSLAHWLRNRLSGKENASIES